MITKHVRLPVIDAAEFHVGDCILVSGRVFAARDAVLPKICETMQLGRLADLGVEFGGNALLHTAVSPAGIGPTSSNKLEIEESFSYMCTAGIKLFMGKGALSQRTASILEESGAAFAVVPPVTALLEKGIKSRRIVAWPELGMEALWELQMQDCPAIIAVAHGESLF